MNTSTTWKLRSIMGRIMMGLVLAAIIGSMDVVPASGDDNRNRGGRHDERRYENRGRDHDRNRHVQRRRVYRSYGYRERVYVPPPVILAPPPPPGIGIFFPPIIFRP